MMKLEFLVKLESANPERVGFSKGAGLASAVHLERSGNQETIVFSACYYFSFHSNKKICRANPRGQQGNQRDL
jgi:hypothetical protein